MKVDAGQSSIGMLSDAKEIGKIFRLSVTKKAISLQIQ